MSRETMFVTGSLGLVGSRFVELFPDKSKLLTPDLPDFDLTDKDLVMRSLLGTCPQAILHFAAYTDVGAAEKQRGDKTGPCWQVNVKGTENLISAARKTGSGFYHISTDMVFNGSSDDPGPYPEDHQPESDPAKITWYGYTKAVAERSVAEADGTIIRIIYPVRARFGPKLDYLRKPLQLFDQGKLYPLFTDQQVSISYIDEICLALQKIIDQRLTGVFHVSSPDTASPYELISYLIAKTRGQTDVVKPASLAEFLKHVDNPTRYPQFGGLQVQETERRLGIKFSPWKRIIDQLIAQGISF